MKKIFCGALALIIACISAVGCGDKNSGSDDSLSVSIGENGVSDRITPAEGSEEYDLGSYRVDKNGIKLYYDDTDISPELMLALEKYFMSFQNEDFEAYKQAVSSDYVQRYDKYLSEVYSETLDGEEEYTIESSFKMQCENLRERMKNENGSDSLAEDDKGDFKITRIRAERPELAEGETKEEYIKKFFSYLDNVFDMDYYDFVADQADDFEFLTFFIIAEGEDGEEHLMISETDIVFAEKDGEYYTFG